MASLTIRKRQLNYLRTGIGPLFRFIIVINMLGLSACVSMEPQVHSLIVNDRVISGTSNEVQIIRAGIATPAASGASLQVGDVITTGPNSQAVLLLNGGAVEVIQLENSEVQISSIFVKLGEVFVRVKNKLKEKFEVESDYGVAAVEGTEFIVGVRRGVDYRCVTLEGEVEVRSANGNWPIKHIRTRQELTLQSGSMPVERTLSQAEYNLMVSRINKIERIYRPNSMQLLVPDVSGLMEADARRILLAQNLTVGDVVGRITTRARVGEILTQTPAAGKRIKAGKSVRLEVEAQPTTVPNLTTISLNAAISSLKIARLKQGTVNSQITGQHKAGVVFRQQPRAGESVPVDSVVDLWVEAESISVPELVNRDIEKARQLLKAKGLRVGKISKHLTEGVADGTVLKQDKPANELVHPGTHINLTVAERGIKVPNLINNSRSGASKVLATKGLKLGSSPTRPSRKKAGSVFDQTPSAGTLVRPGTKVNIEIAGKCRVPSVKGMTFAAASSSISNADLVARKGKVGNYDITKVYAQRPPANSGVNCGSVVNLDMGTYVVQ